MQFLLVATQLITVHQIDGRAVDINPRQITKVAEPRAAGDPKKQMHDEVNCVIYFVDGSYLSVDETCPKVRELIEKGP
jgi:hypothetical protein